MASILAKARELSSALDILIRLCGLTFLSIIPGLPDNADAGRALVVHHGGPVPQLGRRPADGVVWRR